VLSARVVNCLTVEVAVFPAASVLYIWYLYVVEGVSPVRVTECEVLIPETVACWSVEETPYFTMVVAFSSVVHVMVAPVDVLSALMLEITGGVVSVGCVEEVARRVYDPDPLYAFTSMQYAPAAALVTSIVSLARELSPFQL